jgi:hypothetical protein
MYECMYVSQCLCVSMYGLDWLCRRCFIMYANSEYIVCMYVCLCVSAVVTSMEVQLRYIEPFDIGEWQRMYRPELLDYSGILQRKG